jgi:hypothetical protein
MNTTVAVTRGNITNGQRKKCRQSVGRDAVRSDIGILSDYAKAKAWFEHCDHPRYRIVANVTLRSFRVDTSAINVRH